ncbi:biotin/lipoyl-containing protein, partial [Mycolicibacterium canariasense]
MAISVQMPALGESVTEGTVTRWLKQEGDTVEVDEPLLEVSTDKVDTEIPAPASGVLTKIIAAEDDVVEVGGDLALIGEAGESVPAGDTAPAEEAQPEPEPAAEQAQPEPEPEPAAPAESAPAASGESAPAASGESTSVKMPELGESVTEGTVTRWLKKVGDTVAVDEPLVEVSTDKVDTEIPSPVAGVLVAITAEEDDVVAVGGELAKIGAEGSAPAAAPAPAAPAPEPKPEPKPEPAPEPKPEPAAATPP